jgi:hypothetical protein
MMNEIARKLAARLFDRPKIQNWYRSARIEAMVEPHLARRGWRFAGDSWAGWDFEHENHAKLEKRQSASRQTWSQATDIPAYVAFNIAARTRHLFRAVRSFP